VKFTPAGLEQARKSTAIRYAIFIMANLTVLVWSRDWRMTLIQAVGLFIALGPMKGILQKAAVVYGTAMAAFANLVCLSIGLDRRNMFTAYLEAVGPATCIPSCAIAGNTLYMTIRWRKSWGHWLWHHEGHREQWVEKASRSFRLCVGLLPLQGNIVLLVTRLYERGEREAIPPFLILCCNALVGGTFQVFYASLDMYLAAPAGVSDTPKPRKVNWASIAWIIHWFICALAIGMSILVLARVGSDEQANSLLEWFAIELGAPVTASVMMMIQVVPRTQIQWRQAHGGRWPKHNKLVNRDWGMMATRIFLADLLFLPIRNWFILVSASFYAREFSPTSTEQQLVMGIIMNLLIQLLPNSWKTWNSPSIRSDADKQEKST
jgi:hypothetical protein